jgi:hypothetical protein
MLDGGERTTELVIGAQRLCELVPAIRELRQRCGQQDDLTTDPQYFIAVNTLKGRRVTAVLIRRKFELEACVLFFELPTDRALHRRSFMAAWSSRDILKSGYFIYETRQLLRTCEDWNRE